MQISIQDANGEVIASVNLNDGEAEDLWTNAELNMPPACVALALIDAAFAIISLSDDETLPPPIKSDYVKDFQKLYPAAIAADVVAHAVARGDKLGRQDVILQALTAVQVKMTRRQRFYVV